MSDECVAKVRVIYADTDQMGVANNGIYLRWFEIGRAEWLRARGVTYKEIEAEGVMLPVVEAHARYRAPALYDDLIEIWAKPLEVRAASVRFGYRLLRESDQTLLCEGHTIHACLGADRKVRRFPASLAKLLMI